MRILLVDDDVLISGLLGELLADIGHDICGVARTEMEAVAAAARNAPELMIIDAHLEMGSGVSAMDTILQRCAMPHIFMTGGSRLTIPPNAMVLHKPFNTAALIAALDSVERQFAAP